MAGFTEIMQRQDETISSPDGGVSARLINGGVKETKFATGRYKSYTETSLESQLASLAKLVFIARRRARRSALKEALGTQEYPKPRQPTSPKERLIRERAQETVAEVKTGYLQVRVTGGGTRWTVRIRQGTLERVGEDEFVAELSRVVARAIQAWKEKMSFLRSEIFGPGFETWAFIDPPKEVNRE